VTGWAVQDGAVCPHAATLPAPPGPATACTDCLRVGGRWVHLRRCLTCDHVGCCDSSPLRHAAAHWQATGHPVAASAEPGEHWAWCRADAALLLPR
jgi:Zn-finger in ubiquitin-hydrolases and other protein